MKKFKNDSELGNTSSLSSASTVPYANTRSPAINLTKITIPTFKGDPNTFIEFINSFKCTIDSNDNLSKIDKFIYLKSFLSEEAYKTISGLALTKENYEQSLDLLQNRHGKTEVLISGIINKLLNIEPVRSISITKLLLELYDECEVSIRLYK